MSDVATVTVVYPDGKQNTYTVTDALLLSVEVTGPATITTQIPVGPAAVSYARRNTDGTPAPMPLIPLGGGSLRLPELSWHDRTV